MIAQPDVLVPTQTLLVGFAVIALLISGGALIVSGARVGRDAIARRVNIVKPPAVVVAKPSAKSLEKRPLASGGSGDSEREDLEVIRKLSRFGIPPARAHRYFTIGRAMVALIGGALMVLGTREFGVLSKLPFAGLFAFAAGALAGWLLPPMYIKSSARRRAEAVADSMPEALDLLVVCVDAGLSLENALSRVVIELAQSRPPLADELAMMAADMQILPSRDEAFLRMANRVDMPSIRSVATTLAQTLRYGTPLAQALRVIAAEMRDDALVHLEERANQLPALLTVPMMVFIMPTIFLIVGGPAALQLIDVLSRR